MSRQAWVYIWSVLGLGALIVVLTFPGAIPDQAQLITWGILTLFATLAQLFKVEAPNHQTYYATLIFAFAALLLTSPFLFALLVIISYLVEWAKERLTRSPLLRNWYLQPFNISTHIVAGFAATWVLKSFYSPPLFASLLAVLIITAAAITYVITNHLLIGLAISLARKVTLRDSGVLQWENLASDFVLLSFGFTVAAVWTLNAWLIIPALVPLALLYRALMIPQLRKEAQTDSKTGLWNAGHFSRLYSAEFERARRFGRPLAVIMADLDLLRNVNNTYGHLAGDQVLAEIGLLIRATIREYDIAGRFGGEEFALVLPETAVLEARGIAERLRHAIAVHEFKIGTSPSPIHVTMSFGIATHPSDATTPNQLIHKADVAVYQAKLQGRNCIVCAETVPHSMHLGAEVVEPGEPAQLISQATLPLPEFRLPGLVDESPAEMPERMPEAEAAPAEEAEAAPRPARWVFWVFLGLVIGAGVGLSALGLLSHAPLNVTGIVLLAVAAFFTEVFRIDLYGDNTISISALILFAAALALGLPGVIAVSTVVVLTHRVQDEPPWYKSAFNWGTHVLSGGVPALLAAALPFKLSIGNLPQWLIAALLLGAVLYLVESVLVATAIALSQGRSVVSTWRSQFEWLATHYLILSVLGLFLAVSFTELGPLGLAVFVLPALMMRYAQKQYVDRTADSTRELKRMNQELTQANQEIITANQAIRELNQELFATLSKAMDARDPYVSGHADHVARYALAIGSELGLPAERQDRLRQAGMLHDLGKIAIREQVLNKPGQLSDDEYDYIKGHATLGANLLTSSHGLRALAPFIRHHHERWDGSGYPDGLRGEQIPLEARILAVADAVEAMASDRPYHRAMGLPEIIDEIRRCAGTQFDPGVVAAFVNISGEMGGELVVNSAREVMEKSLEGDDGKGTFRAIHTLNPAGRAVEM